MITMILITGILNLICFGLLLLKGPVRKYGSEEFNERLQILHKPVSGMACLTILLHGLTIFLQGGSSNMPAVVLGILTAAEYLLLVTLCHVMKDERRKMRTHRICSVILLGLILVHVICALSI